MAHEGVIVQITYCFILKYKEIVTLKCNIYEKASDRKMDVSIEWSFNQIKFIKTEWRPSFSLVVLLHDFQS